MSAIEKLRRQHKPMGSAPRRRMFSFTARDIANLREITEAFRKAGMREPSGSLAVGAGLEVLKERIRADGPTDFWFERNR